GRAIEPLVLVDYALGIVERLEVGAREHTGPGGVGTRTDDVACIDQILIGEHVVGVGLRIAPGGDAVGEVGEESPVLEVENATANFAPVRVDVDEAGHDGGAAEVDDFGTVRNGDLAVLADGSNAVVFHHDIGIGNDVVAMHGDDLRSAQD